MLLYDVFVDIYEQKSNIPLQGAIITSTELAFEMKRAVAHYRCLKTPDQVTAYRQLVTHFAKKMQGQTACLILPTLLDGLAADDSTLDDRQACAILAHLYTVNTQTQANVYAPMRMYMNMRKHARSDIHRSVDALRVRMHRRTCTHAHIHTRHSCTRASTHS